MQISTSTNQVRGQRSKFRGIHLEMFIKMMVLIIIAKNDNYTFSYNDNDNKKNDKKIFVIEIKLGKVLMRMNIFTIQNVPDIILQDIS